MRDGVYVVGAGGHAKVVIGALQAAGYAVAGVLDDNPLKWGARLLGVRVLGAVSDLGRFRTAAAVIAIGDNRARRSVAEQWQGDWVSVVHPQSYVHSTVQIGSGTVVLAGVIVQPDAVIGEHCILNTGCSVDHDCVIGDYVHVAPGVRLAGGVHLEDEVLMGIGSVAIPGVRIGRGAMIGAGAAVVGDVPAGVIAVGVPAKPARERNETR